MIKLCDLQNGRFYFVFIQMTLYSEVFGNTSQVSNQISIISFSLG